MLWIRSSHIKKSPVCLHCHVSNKGQVGDGLLFCLAKTLYLCWRSKGKPNMIMRIFQVVTRPGKEAEFAKFFHETAIPLMKWTEGIVSVLPGAPRPDSPCEFSFVMV